MLRAWAGVGEGASRRLSVSVDASLVAGATREEETIAKEAATALLGLPWELLHDGDGFLFQGARPTRVRRRLPNTRVLDVPVVAPPIRVLLITARPEDDACGYLDHRASALPLVAATEELGDLLQLRLLHPPTYPALESELRRAAEAGEPYQVVHFDGHGVYDRRLGLGALCFEDPRDAAKLTGRRHETITTDQLGPLLTGYRIPLVVLEACQTALAEAGSKSVASDLLERGVASVVAMSHSVLLETARRFVSVLYAELARGQRVGKAMLAGQRALHVDPCRGQLFGAGELRLSDWFVPVLYQEKDDPQLFQATPTLQTKDDLRTRLRARLGEVPEEPPTGFVGRSRDLLAMERLLRLERWAVIRGQGGEGKTALAAELARWLVRSQQVRRAAFVSVESHGHSHAVLDALGRQLVSPTYSAAKAESQEQAILPIERALRERPTLLVIDNMESVLLPPYLDTPEPLSEEAERELTAILALAERLGRAGQTRILFTSREALPAPFATPRQVRELRQLERPDAVKLIERALAAGEGQTGAAEGEEALRAQREDIEALADAVRGHARTLALLAPELRRRGVEATRLALEELMAELERRFPGSREQSLFASVELSLRRLSETNRQRARVLGVFHGGVDLVVLRMMTAWEPAELGALAGELVASGLATPTPPAHLSLNPALCPYLKMKLEPEEREGLTTRWRQAMAAFLIFLEKQRSKNAELAATLTVLELPNLFALLDQTQGTAEPEATIAQATSLYSLLQNLGKPRLLERVGRVRDTAAAALGESWSHARFEATRTRLEQHLAGNQSREALAGARLLLERARAAGERAYQEADYDLAMACLLLAQVLQTAGGAGEALPLAHEAGQRFEAIARERPDGGAATMAYKCIADQGNCLLALGRPDKAAAAYEEAIRRAEQRGDDREVAVVRGQIGSVRLDQRLYQEALAAYQDALQRFTRLNEPASMAVAWHQIGIAQQDAGQPEAAEEAYNQSLAISVRLGDTAGQAMTLNQLGNLYDDDLQRHEEAVAFYRRAAFFYSELGVGGNEGRCQSNLAETLRKLHRLDEARRAIRRAIACKAPLGHAAEPWNSWAILSAIETDAGNPAAATEARRQALSAFLAYRRGGGENHLPDGRLALLVRQALAAGDPASVAFQLQQVAAAPEAAQRLPFLSALQAIAGGGRDPALAEDPALGYREAAEVLLLIEALERGEPA